MNVTKYEAQLNARLRELTDRLHEIENELDSHMSKDWEELAVEREEDEVLETMGRAGMVEINMIRAALKRVSDGEFGFCVKCGAEIAPERLDLLPATPFCKSCAA